MEGTGCLRWIGFGVFSVIVVGLALPDPAFSSGTC